MNYDYGPNVDFNIRFVGDMEKYNGSYEEENEQGKYLVQAICHMVYQVKKEVQSAPNGLLWANSMILHWVRTPQGNEYALYTRDMMTVFHIIETGFHSFDFEFFSPRQFEKSDPFINYAFEHSIFNGRAK